MHFLISSNFESFTAITWSSLFIYYNSITVWYLFKDHDQFISKSSQYTLSKEYKTWFIIWFINHIQKLYFYFCVNSSTTFSYMISTVSVYLQIHPGAKHWYEKFCTAFPGISYVLSVIPIRRDGTKNDWALYRHNMTRWWND